VVYNSNLSKNLKTVAFLMKGKYMDSKYKVTKISEKNKIEFEKPDFIYNRFDIQNKNGDDVLLIEDGVVKWNIQYIRKEDTAEIGVQLCNISSEVIRVMEEYLFANYENLKKIKIYNSIVAVGCSRAHNYFVIDLPETDMELKMRLSSKGRYNIRREKKIIEREFNGYHVVDYTIDTVPREVMNEYFRMKEVTHGTIYDMSVDEYLQKFFVSNIYVLYLEERIGAVLLSCEQCADVYLENLTYEKEYAKYSLGQILYDIYLTKLIEKGKRSLLLGGGNLEYKRRYGSVELTVYDCILYRNKGYEVLCRLKEKQYIFLRTMYRRYIKNRIGK